MDDGVSRDEFALTRANLGLHVPPMVWATQYRYSPDAVLLVLASPVMLLSVVAIVLTGINDVRGMQVDGSDNFRDALSIITGVVCGIMIAALLGALVWVEMKDPTKVAPPAA